jgi:hypothetical protein
MSQPWAGNLMRAVADSEMQQDLTSREALAEDRLDDFVRQEEDGGVELANGSELERALAPSHYEAPGPCGPPTFDVEWPFFYPPP